MFGLLGIVAIILTTKRIFDEATTKPCPPGMRVDMEAYNRDYWAGMSQSAQDRKLRRGGYYAPIPEPKRKDIVVDVYRYNRDVEWFGKEWAEEARKKGGYLYKT